MSKKLAKGIKDKIKLGNIANLAKITAVVAGAVATMIETIISIKKEK